MPEQWRPGSVARQTGSEAERSWFLSRPGPWPALLALRGSRITAAFGKAREKVKLEVSHGCQLSQKMTAPSRSLQQVGGVLGHSTWEVRAKRVRSGFPGGPASSCE